MSKSESVKQVYKPAKGGRIEIRFNDSEDQILTQSIIKSIQNKTGLKPDKIMFSAMNEYNKMFDDNGNKI